MRIYLGLGLRGPDQVLTIDIALDFGFGIRTGLGLCISQMKLALLNGKNSFCCFYF